MTATAVTCCAGKKAVEARVPVASAEAAVARDYLPALIASPAVVRPEDLIADRAEPTY